MVAVISVVIFGLIFAFFATLNTSPVTINLWYTTWTNVPLYIAVLASLAAGILLSAVFYLGKSIADYFKIGSTEHELKKTKQTITDLTKQVHELELENTRLKTKAGEGSVDEDSL